MSELENLIQRLCPDGVEYKPLGDVCEIRSGWGFPNHEQGKKFGKYPLTISRWTSIDGIGIL